MAAIVTTEEGTAITATIERDRKTAADYLLHYTARLADYERAKEEHLGMRHDAGVPGRGNLPGKPTEAQAIRSAAYDEEHMEEYIWLKAVAIAEHTLSDRKLLFLQARREAERHGRGCGKGRPSWVSYTQARFSELVADRFLQADVELYRRTAIRWWKQIVVFAAEIHARIS